MNLAEIREKYPQYNDLSDEDLARGLHNRHYSDLDFDDFSNRIGYQPRPPVAETPEAQTLERQVISPTIEPRLGVAGIPPYMSREEYDVTGRPEDVLRKRLERPAPVVEPTREPETIEEESTTKGLASYIPSLTLKALQGLIHPLLAPLGGTRFDTNKLIADAIEYWEEKTPELGALPDVGLGVSEKGKIRIEKRKTRIKDLLGMTAQMTGALAGPVRYGLKAGELVTTIPQITARARPFYRSIMKGMIGGSLIGEGDPQQTLQDMALFGIFEPIAYGVGKISAVPTAIRKSTPWRKMTIKERGLILQSLDDVIQKNPNISEGKILRKWDNPQWRKEALKRYVVPKKEPAEPIIPPEPKKPPKVTKKPPTIEEVPKEVTLYRGERVGQEGANYYSPDKEWARQFTQSGQDKEISSITISKDKIYRPDKLPKAYGLDDADIAMIQEAGEKGFKAIWMDEGKGQPESVFIIDKKRLKPKPKKVVKPTTAELEARMAAAMEKGERLEKPTGPPTKGETIATQINKEMPGHELKFDGEQDWAGVRPNQYQFTAKAGPAKGATFYADVASLESARTNLEAKIKQFKEAEPVKLPEVKPKEVKPAGVKELYKMSLEEFKEHGPVIGQLAERLRDFPPENVPTALKNRVVVADIIDGKLHIGKPGDIHTTLHKRVIGDVVSHPELYDKHKVISGFYDFIEKKFYYQSYKQGHKFVVQQAIAEGKITKHPDYPELGKKVVKAKEVKPAVVKEKPYFTVKKAQNLTRTNVKTLSDKQLQDTIVKVRDFERYTNNVDVYGDKLAEGGYFKRVADPSAKGVVPVDPHLPVNLRTTLDEAIVERNLRKKPPKAEVVREKPDLLAEITEAVREYPEVKPPAKEVKKYVSMMIREVETGQPPVTIKFPGEYERPEYRRLPSDYPEFMRRKGWTGKEVVTALKKGVKGEKLGIKQQVIYDAAKEYGEARYRHDKGVILETFPGFQNIYERWAARMKKKKARPKEDIKIFDTGKIIKQRANKARSLVSPPVYEAELNVVKRMPELRPKPLGGWLENPIRTFEELGSDAKELYYRPIKEAEHRVALERKALNKRIKVLRKGISSRSRRRIGAYATAQQPRGKAIIQAMGVGKVPELKPKEMKVYNALRQEFESFYLRLNEARRLSGKEPFGKVENYFTFIRDLGLLNRMGFNPTLDKLSTINQAFIHLKTTPFRFAKARVKLGVMPIELDAFQIFEQYASTAVRHIHLSPVIAKLREFALTFGTKKTEPGPRWILREEKPRTAKFLTEWLDFQAGQRPPTSMPRVIEKGLMKLNQNLTFAILSANIRSALIQPSALINTFPEIGPIYTLKGIMSLFNPKIRKFVMEKSNLLTRDYDVAVVDAMAAIRAGRIGELKKAVGRKALKPLQLLDMETAKATWYGAYLKAKKEGNYTMQKAINYANDVVTKTQGSAAPSDVAPIQRTALGKAISLFQTFVINQWGFLTRDVLGVKNPRMKNTTRLKKLLAFLGGAIMLNIFYEDLLGINSPLPTPIKAFNNAIEEGEELPSATLRIAKEVVEVVPIVGGGLRYGKGILGATAETIQELAKGNKPVETALKLYGVPGVVQAGKMKRAAKRGETTYGIWVGKYTPKHKRKKKWYIEPKKED